jgi:hypothetical protein
LDRLVFMGTIKTGRVKSRSLSKDTGYGKLDYYWFSLDLDRVTDYENKYLKFQHFYLLFVPVISLTKK